MNDESDRHYLVSPVASGLARLFLIEQKLEVAGQEDISPHLKGELAKQLQFLREKLTETQHRIDSKLAALENSPQHQA